MMLTLDAMLEPWRAELTALAMRDWERMHATEHTRAKLVRQSGYWQTGDDIDIMLCGWSAGDLRHHIDQWTRALGDD